MNHALNNNKRNNSEVAFCVCSRSLASSYSIYGSGLVQTPSKSSESISAKNVTHWEGERETCCVSTSYLDRDYDVETP